MKWLDTKPVVLRKFLSAQSAAASLSTVGYNTWTESNTSVVILRRWFQDIQETKFHPIPWSSSATNGSWGAGSGQGILGIDSPISPSLCKAVLHTWLLWKGLPALSSPTSSPRWAHLKLPPTLRRRSCSLAVPLAGKELWWEASAVPAAPAGELFLLSLSLLPFPGFWHSKIRQKISYLSSFCVLVVNALENLPTWLVLRISSTQAISNPIPSKYYSNLLRQSSVKTNLPHSKGRLVWVLFHTTCTAPGPNLVWSCFRCLYNLAAILNIDKTGIARHILWAVFSNILTEKYVLKMVCWNTTVHFSHRRWK